MKKIIPCRFRFCPSGGGCTFAALLVPPAAPTPPTDSVQADDLSPRCHTAAFAHDAAQQCSKRYHRP